MIITKNGINAIDVIFIVIMRDLVSGKGILIYTQSLASEDFKGIVPF